MQFGGDKDSSRSFTVSVPVPSWSKWFRQLFKCKLYLKPFFNIPVSAA